MRLTDEQMIQSRILTAKHEVATEIFKDLEKDCTHNHYPEKWVTKYNCAYCHQQLKNKYGVKDERTD